VLERRSLVSVRPKLESNACKQEIHRFLKETMSLFSPFKLRGIEFKNRIGVSPMCEYSAKDGHPQPWHLVHLGSRAVGGAGVVFTEATGVQTIGRISPQDTGIYLDAHVDSWRPIAQFIKGHGAVAGMQLAHAGRKGSTEVPWRGGKGIAVSEGGWIPVAPSAVAFDDGYILPRELSLAEIDQVVADFVKAAQRALAAGFQVLEIHAAHGYLLHEFYSPLSNFRKDEYGGSFDNRVRLVLRVARAVREVVPENLPLFIRISATDWTEGGWNIEQSIELCRKLKALGLDLVDTSSGGNVPRAKIPVEAGYQVPFAAAIRRDAGIATGAVGMITEPLQAETIINSGQADMIFLARELLRDPYWPRRAAQALGAKIEPPAQYLRAW
jgi:2,4-dienoyl-CoA reductase-like NADH-dependent reductase (Old Yellow Enzyme family)